MNKFLLPLHQIKKALQCSLIFDTERQLGNFSAEAQSSHLDYLNKEEVSRSYVLNYPDDNLKFLDVGARDGSLKYLLGTTHNLEFNESFYQTNKRKFSSKYSYFGCDLNPCNNEKVLTGDVCSPDFLADKASFLDFFDVIYSNNVFEHLHRPWMTCQHIYRMLKTGGICITIVPFSQRYHEVPGDYFRYTHAAIPRLFEDCGTVEVLATGYDILGRRNNWQGSGKNNDLVPVDRFGAWRETWFTISVIKKL